MDKPRFNMIKWRLKTLPTAGEVAQNVIAGVLTVKEARFILLGETYTESQDDVRNTEEENKGTNE